MAFPPPPGPGPYPLSLAVPSFYVLVGLLFIFVLMLWVLQRTYPGRGRGLEGYLEAAGVDIAFLGFAVALAVALAWKDPLGNRTAHALYQVAIEGYWLTFAIPIVTVGSSVQSRSRGGIPWRIPAIVVAVILFGVFFAYYYANS